MRKCSRRNSSNPIVKDKNKKHKAMPKEPNSPNHIKYSSKSQQTKKQTITNKNSNNLNNITLIILTRQSKQRSNAITVITIKKNIKKNIRIIIIKNHKSINYYIICLKIYTNYWWSYSTKLANLSQINQRKRNRWIKINLSHLNQSACQYESHLK